MKSVIGMLVALGLAAGGSAYGADKPTTKKSAVVKKTAKKMKKKSKKLNQTSAAKSVVGTTAGATASTAPTAAAQTSTTPISTATAQAPLKRWGLLYDTFSETNMQDANFQRGDWDAAETIRVSYKLTPVMSLSLTNTFTHTWGTTSGGDKYFTFEDPYVMLAHSKLIAGLAPGLKTKGYLRFYPGLSETSQSKGQTGFVRGQVSIGGDISKAISLSWEVQPRYYIQQYRTYTTPIRTSASGEVSGGEEKASTEAQLKHFGSLGLTLSKRISLYQNVGMTYVWYHSDAEASNRTNRDTPHKEIFYGETGMGLELTDVLSLTAGIYTESRNMLKQDNAFSMYRDNETMYFLEGTLVF